MTKLWTFMIFVLIAFQGRTYGELVLEIWIDPNNEAVQCEPTYLHVKWQNTSSEEIFVGLERSPVRSRAVSILIDNKVAAKPILVTEAEYAPGAPSTLEPNEDVSDTLPLHLLGLEPGKYNVQAVADFTKLTDQNTLKITKSNSVSFLIRKPQGTDLHALAYAQEIASVKVAEYLDPENAMCSEVLSPPILKLFPDSIYAAWIVVDSLAIPQDLDPAVLKEVIEQGTYPPANAVPSGESTDGWEYLSEGEPMASWQNKWIELILKNHPDFPYAERLRLTLGVNYLVLKNQPEGLKFIKEVAADLTSKEGSWARAFLLLQK